MQHTASECCNCGTDSKCRRREFSEQAWTVLLLWNEVQASAVDQPLCDSCYDELRETLIDRAEELDGALNTSKTVPAQRPATSRSRVRRAG
jgi:hypothetical protein